MVKKRVNLFDPLQPAVGATIMMIGIGGSIGLEVGFLPIRIPGVISHGLPAIATSAVVINACTPLPASDLFDWSAFEPSMTIREHASRPAGSHIVECRDGLIVR